MSSSLQILALVLAIFAAAVFASPAAAAETTGPQAPVGLRVEYLENPTGVDVKLPRFFWVLEHAERGQSQSACQIIVSTDPGAAAGDIWDTGRVASTKTTQVVFAGKSLVSGKTYYWKVRYWDKDGKESPWSATAMFEMGLFDRAEWKGNWIGGNNQLRKEFVLDQKIKRA